MGTMRGVNTYSVRLPASPVQTLDGTHASVVLENNAGVLYRGTKLVHWRQVALRLPKGAQSPHMLAAVHATPAEHQHSA